MDPAQARSNVAVEGEDMFGSVAERWHDNRKSSLDPAHAARVWSRLERDVFPSLGFRRMDEIIAPDVLAMIRKIEARGALDISRRAKQGVGQIFQFAIACGLAANDPTTHLRGALKARPRVRHMSRLPLLELPDFIAKLDGYREADPRRWAITRDALRFVLLTKVRDRSGAFRPSA